MKPRACSIGVKLSNWLEQFSVSILMLGCALLGAGCHTARIDADTSKPAPANSALNVYRVNARLPAQIRRVAVLPLVADFADPDASAGQADLEPILHSELQKRRTFELTFVSAERLQHSTGQRYWTAEEPLPADFFQRLRHELGCDAVLFCRLTRYRAYVPLEIGWNLKLVDSEEPRIRWSVDETFDAGEPQVASSACKYSSLYFAEGRLLAQAGSILLSPRRFGQYSLDAMLATLPTR